MASETNTETHVPQGEPGGSNFPPFDSTTFPSQLLWLAITFGIFYYLMSKVALPRIGSVLEDRRDRIEGDLAEAERLKRETDEAIASYEQALADARQKAHGIAQETRDKLNRGVEDKRAKAEANLNDKLGKAEERIAGIKTAALAQVSDIAVETTGALVESLMSGLASKDEIAGAVKQTMEG
jgi:F-type H+-transporting ATPase subunit b